MIGNIQWNDAGNVQKQILRIPGMVSRDEKYQNAMRNSDEQEARTESERALQNVIFSIMADNMELFKQFQDNSSFKEWLTSMVFNLTYNKEGKPYKGPEDDSGANEERTNKSCPKKRPPPTCVVLAKCGNVTHIWRLSCCSCCESGRDSSSLYSYVKNSKDDEMNMVGEPKTKRQHYVPQFFLRFFTDENGAFAVLHNKRLRHNVSQRAYVIKITCMRLIFLKGMKMPCFLIV